MELYILCVLLVIHAHDGDHAHNHCTESVVPFALALIHISTIVATTNVTMVLVPFDVGKRWFVVRASKYPGSWTLT
jgi:hypothetical protein